MGSLNSAKANKYYEASSKEYKDNRYERCMYENEDAIENTIRYITRTRKTGNEDDLILSGAFGCCNELTSEDWILQFKKVQEFCRDKKIASKVAHEIFTFTNEEIELIVASELNLFCLINDMGSLYYNSGHQVIYAVHYGMDSADGLDTQKKLHVHFVINIVNFENGNLLPTRLSSKPMSFGNQFFRIDFKVKERESQMNRILYRHLGIKNPYEVANPMDYITNAYTLYGT